MTERLGQIAVIFLSVRTEAHDDDYQAAAAAMDALAAAQPGYCGMESARGADRLGITVSYWADEVQAKAWRDHPDHKRIRDLGRSHWYHRYEGIVAEVTRDYAWSAP